MSAVARAGWLFFGAGLVTATFAAAGAAEDAAVSVLVLDVEPVGVEPALAAQAGAAIAQGIAGSTSHHVVTLDDIASAAELAATRESLRCEAEAECLAAIAARYDADLVVAATLGRVGSALTLTVAVHEGRTVNVRGRATTVVDDVGDIPEEAAALVRGLFADDEAASAPRFRIPSGETVSFAVLPLEATGVEPAVARNLTEILAVELKRIEGASVVGLDDVARILELEKEKSALDCSNDVSCLAEVGDALGVDKIVAGQVGRLGDKLVVGARLLDREGVRVDSRVSESFVGEEEQLIRAVRHVARELVGIQAEPGALLVTASESGARLFVDGVERGALPGPPIGELAPGRHGIRVSHGGFYDFHTDVYVDPRETTTLWIVLEEKPLLLRPFLPTWGLAAMAGGSALLALAAAGGGLAALLSRAGEESVAHAPGTVAGKTLVESSGRTGALALATNLLWGAAATSALATLIAVPFVDWGEGE